MRVSWFECYINVEQQRDAVCASQGKSKMDLQKITEYLLDNDSTTRDITFTPAALANVGPLIRLLMADYQQGIFFNQDGVQIEFDSQAICSSLDRGAVFVYGDLESETALFRKIKLFLDWEEEGLCAVELSFFPDDLQPDFKIEQFLSKLNLWWDTLQTREVFVRYENASWEQNNPNDLGVFYHQTRT